MASERETKTCEERIDEQLRGRLEELFPDVSNWTVLKCARHLKSEGKLLETADVQGLRDEVLEVVCDRARESLLSVDKILTFKLCLSWGGPADFFELHWSLNSRSWIGGHYIFQDWGDGARRSIEDGQVEQIADLFGICPELEMQANRS